MHEAKLSRRGRSGTKRMDHKEGTEDSGKEKKHCPSAERQGDVSRDVLTDQLGRDLMLMDQLGYYPTEMRRDPGDQALKEFVGGPTA